MTIQEMHNLFRMGTDRNNNSQGRGFNIPQIDVYLNQALLLYLQNRIKPENLQTTLNSKDIDDFNAIIVEAKIDLIDNQGNVPIDYLYYITSTLQATKGNVTKLIENVDYKYVWETIKLSTFNNGDFEYRQGSITFFNNKIYSSTDLTNSYKINYINLTYIKQHPYMNNSEAIGEYKLPNGKLLNKNQNCILNPTTHQDIVDLAVLIAIGNIADNNLNFQVLKQNINNK